MIVPKIPKIKSLSKSHEDKPKLKSEPDEKGSSHSWTMKTTESGNYLIRVVQGEELRNFNLDLQEFGLYAIYNDFPNLIPENEIWLAGRIPLDEYHFIVSGAMARLKALKEGENESTAYDKGIAKEKAEREKSAGRFEAAEDTPLKSKDPRVTLFLTIEKG